MVSLLGLSNLPEKFLVELAQLESCRAHLPYHDAGHAHQLLHEALRLAAEGELHRLERPCYESRAMNIARDPPDEERTEI